MTITKTWLPLRKMYWSLARGEWPEAWDHIFPDRLFMARRHYGQFRRLRLFIRPRTFNELLRHKMLRNRDPLLKITVEKLSAREYAAGKIGREYLVPLLFV